jgi:IS5 family transposase
MAEQTTFAELAWSTKGKVTRRERFLAGMDAVIPWERLLRVIEPHYPKAGRGRQPPGLEKMLRIYFLQQWSDLSDPAAEDAIYDSESMRRFARIELSEDGVPDETTILRFRRLLETHDLARAIFMEIGALLEERGMLLRQGTIVDATIISAPGSTKNRTRTRDPEMRQTCRGVRYRVNRRGTRKNPTSGYWKRVNRSRSRVRARAEHAFLVVKRQWGFARVRYRGLAKNTARVYTAFALANLFLVRRQLLPPGAKCAL